MLFFQGLMEIQNGRQTLFFFLGGGGAQKVKN